LFKNISIGQTLGRNLVLDYVPATYRYLSFDQ